MKRALLAFGLLLAVAPVLGQPLTLEEALASVAEAHPDLRMGEADRAVALAERELAGARSDWNLNLEAGLRRAKPTVGPDSVSDNTLRLNARKSLYDFGRTALAEQAAESVLSAREAMLLDIRSRRRLDVMTRFFDVLLADMQFDADNEYMAVAYVTLDNARHRLEVGQIAAADLSEIEDSYQDQLMKRNASQLRQRISRAQLASAMNRSGQLSADLADPKLSGNDDPAPEYEALLAVLRANNPRLAAMRAQLAGARQRIEAVRADKSPLLDLELEGGGYSREASTRDNLKAGVVLTWPLYTGRRVDAQMAKEQALFQRLQAETEKLALELEQALLENWLEVGELQRTVRTAAKKHSDYRDLALERARGQYEVELKTNLGDSMAATMAAKLRERRVEYQLALAFARLEALLGQPLEKHGAEQKGQTK
ncbi:MAG: TolC family protein [Gammaproteobacteria bacterium]|nr:TolC family protein [Gammaproteobacteria bacterium]MBU1731310.1 TolC family protein [Gammaproteobacteria bacterium]MBU1892815.1 TolC family protein [Gammaproteobacteria bacterium]